MERGRTQERWGGHEHRRTFYDMLQWIFGPVSENIVHVKSHDRVAGYLGLKRHVYVTS